MLCVETLHKMRALGDRKLATLPFAAQLKYATHLDRSGGNAFGEEFLSGARFELGEELSAFTLSRQWTKNGACKSPACGS